MPYWLIGIDRYAYAGSHVALGVAAVVAIAWMLNNWTVGGRW